jgi:hypothetical protein
VSAANVGGGDVMHRVILIVLLMIADGVFYSAHAQCAPTDKIYIDPRLVPQRQKMAGEVLARVLGNTQVDPATKQMLYRQYLQQDQPIEMPFREGKVLIHPHNPCIQQYIGP